MPEPELDPGSADWQEGEVFGRGTLGFAGGTRSVADRCSPAKRSAMMARVRAANTGPEIPAHRGRRRHSVQVGSGVTTADRVDSFVGHVPLFQRDSATRGGVPLSP